MHDSNRLAVKNLLPLLCTAAILLALMPTASLFPRFWKIFFCFPSAKISSLFLGSQCLPVHEGYLLLRSSIPIRVTQACNAASFFILTLSLFVGLAVKYRKQTSRFIIFSIPLLAYPVTIIANSVRIIAGAYITNWTRAALPENFWPSIHLAVGITVFLTFLTICYLLIAWRLNNAARI